LRFLSFPAINKALKASTTEHIAGKLVDELEGMGTKMATLSETEESRPEGGSQTSANLNK
jgi:hypothetical protein